MILLILTLIAIILIYIKKDKYAFLIHLFVITDGFRFLISPKHEFMGVSFQPADLSILFIFFAGSEYLFRNKMNALHRNFNSTIILKLFKWFMAFILLEIFIDLFLNSGTLYDIYRANRHWLTLAVLPLYHYLKEEDMTWLFNAVVIITFLQLIITCLQPILGFEIAGTIRSDGFDGVRYGLMPYFWFLSFWYVYFSQKLNNKQKLMLLLFIISVLLFTAARKNFLAIIVSFILYYSLKLSIRNFTIIIFIVILSGTLVWNFGSSRIKASYTDSVSIFNTDLNAYIKTVKTGSDHGNFAFRAYLFLERFNYLKERPLKFLFGYGFVHENNMTEQPFSVGIEVNDMQVGQLDAGDISWAALLIRYGFLGMLFVGVIAIVCIRFFAILTPYGAIYRIGFCYITSIFVLSFGDSFLASPTAFLVPYMISIMSNEVVWVSETNRRVRVA